mgnify:CR=1 FL=1
MKLIKIRILNNLYNPNFTQIWHIPLKDGIINAVKGSFVIWK